MKDERFEGRLEPIPGVGCALYTANWDENGYGRYFIGKRGFYAHRYAWEMANGPIPTGLCVCHKCDTPACCNPAHLFLGTHRENMEDMARKGRGSSSRPDRKKISDQQARMVRADPRPHPVIAAEYGVSRSLVTLIKLGAKRRAA